MLINNHSKNRPISLKSAPNKSRKLTELPPLVNLNFRSTENEPVVKNTLALNNYINHSRNLTTDNDFVPRLQLDALNELCNQLIKGQEELKQRLAKQELLIESLRNDRKESKPRIISQENIISKRTESTPRRIQGFTPRSSEESGFFTFRPSETMIQKTKFPREIFSRKSRARPQ